MTWSMNKKGWLDCLFYFLGHQYSDFWLCHTWLDSNGEIRFSKWRTYLDIQGDEKALAKVNQRTLLMNEAVLEIDRSWEDYLKVITDLRNKGIEFYAYATKSHRAKHIHLFFEGDMALMPKYVRERKRLALAEYYGCDKQLASDKHMIALEWCPHWKTRELKDLIENGK